VTLDLNRSLPPGLLEFFSDVGHATVNIWFEGAAYKMYARAVGISPTPDADACTFNACILYFVRAYRAFFKYLSILFLFI
jgi:hypothetical protein